MAKVRRLSSRDFKIEAVQLVSEKGYSVAEAARSLGLHDNLLRSWKQAFQPQGQQAFPAQGNLSPFEEDNRRLHAENKRLQAERDLLQNAAAFFAREATGPTASSTNTKTAGRFVCSARRWKFLPPALTPGRNGHAASNRSDATRSSSRGQPSTPSSRQATAVPAFARNSWHAAPTAVSTRSLS